MWIVYVLQHGVTKEIYIGFTHDVAARIKEHNSGGNKFTTRKDGNWILIYAEAYRSKDDAMHREKRLKHHGSGKHELFKRLEKSFIV